MEAPADNTHSSDVAEIRAHIDSVFKAFYCRDLDALRATHTNDWTGFQISNSRIVRGIDAYLEAAKDVIDGIEASRYEMLDMEIKVEGDIALVFYVAREWIKPDPDEGETTILLRALDVYRREHGHWNQCGSNILVMQDVP